MPWPVWETLCKLSFIFYITIIISNEEKSNFFVTGNITNFSFHCYNTVTITEAEVGGCTCTHTHAQDRHSNVEFICCVL